jgi:hypothetical protein
MTDVLENTTAPLVEDTESLLKKIEEFFAHLFQHTHPDTHPAVAAAKANTLTAVVTGGVPVTGTEIVEPIGTPTAST